MANLDDKILLLISKGRNSVDLSFYERYRYRYQTLASFFKILEIFIHRFSKLISADSFKFCQLRLLKKTVFVDKA